MRIARISGAILAATFPAAAQYCNPRQFQGAYGFQLSGTTTISGDTKPVAAMGRLEFDGRGGVSGSASVNFAGYLLGNPVTGAYQLRQDCRLTWTLQDDSGAFQHFAGTLTPDLQRAAFSQTDPGAAQHGTLSKVARECSAARIQGNYDLTISGNSIPMNPGESRRRISVDRILVTIDAAGNLARLDLSAATPAGAAAIDADCIVDLTLLLPETPPMKFRGILVTGGKEILAIGTDPGAAVNARLTAR